MEEELRKILEDVRAGSLSTEDALTRWRAASYEDIGYAKVDLDRRARQGVAEVIYGAGKTGEQIAGIAKTLTDRGQSPVVITRMDREKAETVAKTLPLSYDPVSRCGIVGDMPAPTGLGPIAVACAGTSDLPVAEEAALCAEAFGNQVIRLYDVGVVGLDRLLSHVQDLRDASVIIAVAGLTGALPTVIGGLVACPVIAVPTSVGYGASFEGLSALLSMLNSAASGVTVVNIDNGFGAAYAANLINHMEAKN